MYIPQTMKSKIASTFYDKSVDVVSKTTTRDAEGGVISTGVSVIDSFKGNVSFANCKVIQEEYGLDYNIDISITTDYNQLELDDIISYDNTLFTVTDILKSDSHLLVVGTKWR